LAREEEKEERGELLLGFMVQSLMVMEIRWVE